MPTERMLMGKLAIYGRVPGQSGGWLYDQASFLYKANKPDDRTANYDAFSRQVITAIVAMEKNGEAKKVIDAFKKIDFQVDVIPVTGGGFFVPYCEDAKGSYELPKRDGTGAVIAWDATTDYTHSKTANGTSTTYPPWVILAHELGHAIQLHTSGDTGGAWLTNYAANQEVVEMDNITRHETPIVQSLGLAPRVRYL